MEPLNPALPAVPQVMVLPRMSVIVINTLLKVAEICTIPSASTVFRERFAPDLPVVGAVIGYFFVAFFLPAMARRGPFFVRALV